MSFLKQAGQERSRLVQVLVIVAALAAGCGTPKPTILRVDHASGKVTLPNQNDRLVQAGSTIRVPEEQLIIEFVNTSTPFYTYNINREPSVTPDIAVLQSFVKASGAVAVDLARTLSGGRMLELMWDGDKPDDGTDHMVANVRDQGVITMSHISRIENLLLAGNDQELSNLRYIHMLSIRTLHNLGIEYARNDHGSNVSLEEIGSEDHLAQMDETVAESCAKTAAQELCQVVGSAFTSLVRSDLENGRSRLRLRDSLVEEFAGLDKQSRRLRQSMAELEDANRSSTGGDDVATVVKTANEILVRADEVLTRAPAILSNARHIERLTIRAMTASDTARDTVDIPFTRGRSLTINVAPEKEGILGTYAVREPFTFKVNAFRDWWIRPTIGLTLGYARDAEFQQFVVREDDDGRHVVPEGQEDRRLNFMISLGLVPTRWQYGDTVQWALELHATPSTDLAALGAGLSLGYAIDALGTAKLQLGWLWMKHQQPTGSEIRHAYGPGLFFVGLSISGWQAFIPG